MVGPLFGIRPNLQFLLMAQCLKITEKVSFNNASEASYVYILNGSKKPKMVNLASFETLKLEVKQNYQTGHFLIGEKLVEYAKIQKLKCDIFGDFQTLCSKVNEAS